MDDDLWIMITQSVDCGLYKHVIYEGMTVKWFKLEEQCLALLLDKPTQA